ncbi:radical SAM protein [Bacteroides sp. OM05-12]|jgi:MoaA/NifB/PqqE/SkfB family radical SAM enzyme|uniref:radical SAM protein n=2 Tax=unclassified Bacteroides TaxID=2646097 RepID=UPI001F224C56|nr:radical SAM protein [Bacteroides sp. OM05-12]
MVLITTDDIFMNKVLYIAGWFFKAKFLGWRRPLQSVIFISDQCNLKCKHCNIRNSSNPHVKTYRQIREELEYCYMLGSRFIDIKGGEPMIWRDGEETINDLCLLARRIGFYFVTVTTNAQKPFHDNEANLIWVELDGIGDCHDAIHGEGTFERLEENVAKSGHHKLYATMTINNLNYKNVHDTILYVRESPYFQSISLNFHTPYQGTEEFMLDTDKRKEVIDMILKMKKEGYPIANSRSGLKLMKRNKFKRQCWMTNYVTADGTWYPSCPGSRFGVCDNCGFSAAVEMSSSFSFKLDAIWAHIRLRL